MNEKPQDGITRPLDKIVSWCFYDGGFWIRFFSRGFSIVNKIKHQPLFSERNGYRKVLRIGKYGLEYLHRS